MAVDVIVTKRIQVGPNTENYVDLYTVSPSKRFKLKRVEIHFPVGTLSELLVRVLYGWTAVAPTDGYAVGDDVKHVYDVDITFGSMSRVRAYLKNTNPTSTRECIITLVGVEK